MCDSGSHYNEKYNCDVNKRGNTSGETEHWTKEQKSRLKFPLFWLSLDMTSAGDMTLPWASVNSSTKGEMIISIFNGLLWESIELIN